MVKTTVYLDESQAAALRRMSRESGRSQAEIIREAVAAKTEPVLKSKRVFKSFGAGASGDGEPIGDDIKGALKRAGWGQREPNR